MPNYLPPIDSTSCRSGKPPDRVISGAIRTVASTRCIPPDRLKLSLLVAHSPRHRRPRSSVKLPSKSDVTPCRLVARQKRNLPHWVINVDPASTDSRAT